MVIFTKKLRTLDPHLPIVWDKVLKKTFFFLTPSLSICIVAIDFSSIMWWCGCGGGGGAVGQGPGDSGELGKGEDVLADSQIKDSSSLRTK